MPVMSYLVYPTEGGTAELRARLAEIPECHVTPATNAELLILVTDTDSSDREKELVEELRALPSLSLLALVSGFADEESEPMQKEVSTPTPYRPSDQLDRRR